MKRRTPLGFRLAMSLVTSLAALLLVAFSVPSRAQDTVSVSISDTARPQPRSRDTSRYGPVLVIKTKPGADTGAEIDVTFHRKNHQKKQLKNVRISWLNFDFGFNNYTDRSDYGSPEVNDFVHTRPGEPEATSSLFSLRGGKSVNVNIWPVMATVNLITHHVNLITGIGIEMNNYRYARPVTYVDAPSGTYVITDSVAFKKDKLFTEYLTVPLLLNFETAPYHTNSSFRISFGPTFGLLVKSRTKQVSSARGKVKNNDPFNLENFRLGLRGEIGFGPVTLYGSYSRTPIHQNGLKQYPFSIGVELISHSMTDH
jgi:hypothetical protein